MNIKTAIYNKLLSLSITADVWDAELPQNPVYPTTVYDLIDEVPIGRSHDADVSPFREARVQIDVYSEDSAEADTLIEQYFEELGAFDGLLSDGLSPATNLDVVIRYDATNPRGEFLQEPTLKSVKVRSMDFLILY